MMQDDKRLRILISIGGGPEAFTGIKFAARLSKKSCANIALLYVRPLDAGLHSGGMEVRVARENVLDWGLELPGMTNLNKALDILHELGEIERETEEEWYHRELSGDPAGEYRREYQNPCGGKISLRLRTNSDITSAVVDEADRFKADIVIVGGSPEPVGGFRKFITPKSLALKIAAHMDRSIIVARHLEPGQGHIVCVQDTDRSRAMIHKEIRFAVACGCSVTLLSVAHDPDDLDSARKSVEDAAAVFRQSGIEPLALMTEVGDPVDVITQVGYGYSLIVMAESGKPWFAKGFSVAHDVAAKARNSVLIIK